MRQRLRDLGQLANGQLSGVTSTGRRNTLAKSVSWCFKEQCLSRPFVELSSDRVEVGQIAAGFLAKAVERVEELLLIIDIAEAPVGWRMHPIFPHGQKTRAILYADTRTVCGNHH